MTAAALDPALRRLPPMDLAELLERAALQTRRDRKYLLPLGSVRALLDRLAPDTRVLEIDGRRSFGYRSLYFDTPDLLGYRLTALRRRVRFKVRTRLYEESGECWLEVKTPGSRENTVKWRLPHDPAARTTLGAGRSFVDEVLAGHRVPDARHLTLVPTLTTRYDRATLYLPASGSRVTVDTDLLWDDGAHALRRPRLAVVETKTGSSPSAMDRLLWRAGHRPVRVSKYATGLAALRPELSAVPWRRVLRRHLAEADAGRLPGPGEREPAGRAEEFTEGFAAGPVGEFVEEHAGELVSGGARAAGAAHGARAARFAPAAGAPRPAAHSPVVVTEGGRTHGQG